MGIYLCTYFQSDKFLNWVLDMLPNYTKKFWCGTEMKVDFSSPNNLMIDQQPPSVNAGYYQNEYSTQLQEFVPQKQGYKNVQKDTLPERGDILVPIQYQLPRKVDVNQSNNHQVSVSIHGKCPQLKYVNSNPQILQDTESQIIQYISELTKSKTDLKADKISIPHFLCTQPRSLEKQSKPGRAQLNYFFEDSTFLSKNRWKAPEVNQNQEIFQISNIFTTNVSYKPLLYYGQPCQAKAYIHQRSTSDINKMTEYNKKIGEAVQREVMYNRGFQYILAPSTVKRPEHLRSGDFIDKKKAKSVEKNTPKLEVYDVASGAVKKKKKLQHCAPLLTYE